MKLDWGEKIECPSCNTMFYDMKKSELICPRCKNKFKNSDIKRKRIKGIFNKIELDNDIKTEKDLDFTAESFDDPYDDSEDIIRLEKFTNDE